MTEVLIVGAGPAGLSAALILGRCRRNVLICDTGVHRNVVSKAVHGFLSRDGMNPIEFLQICHEQLALYENLCFKKVEVVDIKLLDHCFEVFLRDEEGFKAKKVILATGIKDELPSIPQIDQFFGKSVFLCPYCDGWEVRDQPIAIYGQGERGPKFALNFTRWSKDLILCTDGACEIKSNMREKLKKFKIPIFEDPISQLEGKNGYLENIVFKTGRSCARKILFFNTPTYQVSDLPAKLGCEFTPKGEVKTGENGQTCIPGLYVVGDASRDLKLVVIAAAEGAKAAFAINSELLETEVNL